ncbi:MAG: methylmalonate-semialdehyde dehydrogenase [Acidimicrobiaceae bacterium]|jgi:malonate-semialdehyde dehydrogenase (acetylating)/methylmalonate-semialdehyde dehydrogenase|nr:methylmalonate-semialdehyde dehydrogenase [Acidimicrobiaceae bacterium]
MMRRIDHFIAGKQVTSGSGRVTPVFDPATGKQTAEVGLASTDEVDLAIATAKEAFASWRHTSLSRRTEVMFGFRQILDARRSELAAAISAEHGKVLGDAAGEVARGLDNVEFACGIASQLKGGYTEQASTGIDVYSVRQPLGVVVGITPFNFPVMVPLWMLAGAIACGNSFVLKPSEKDPSPSLLLAEMLAEAGLPDGVFNVVQGDKVAVDRLLEHPDVAAASFVGSTPVARHVYERGTSFGKRVQALGGAKNHMVVLPDADLDAAADAAVSAAYGSAGERCMAVSVVVAVGTSADPLVTAIAERLPSLAIGPATDPASEMGPLISRQQRDRVVGYLEDVEQEGGRIVVDGRAHELSSSVDADGFFVGASLVDGVRPGMRVYDDEIFGPVLSVVRCETYDEALALVNANPYGNGAAIFTRDGGAARRFQVEVECGMVGVNVPIPVPVAYYSFGGWKSSLFGDAHMYGPSGVDFYTRTKVLTTRWPRALTSDVDLSFPTAR